MSRVYGFAVRALASQKFFYLVLTICVLQAIWYAFSFAPAIFDEQRHLGVIYAYSHHISPFFSYQDPAHDHLGQITRDGSYLFYYIMSWPLRLIRLFTDSSMAQIIGLRLINLVFFTSGLVLFRKALLAAKDGLRLRIVVNVVLLFFVLTPAVALLPGAVNYDNLVFLLFAGMLMLAVKTVRSRELSFPRLAGILAVGLTMCVVKWTAIALFAPMALYLAFQLYQQHGANMPRRLKTAFRKAPQVWRIVLVIAMVVSLGLFIERPVANTLHYGKPDAPCERVLSTERCMKFATFRAYAQGDAVKPADFQPKNPVIYFLKFWAPKMINTQANQLERTFSQLTSAQVLFTTFAFVGVALVLIYLRDFLKNHTYRFLLFITLAFVLLLFIDEYLAYATHGVPAAIRSRYLIPVLPIFMYFVALAFVSMFEKSKQVLLALACLVLLAFAQGGGIITFLLTTPDNYYWPNVSARSVNHQLQKVVRPFVKQ